MSMKKRISKGKPIQIFLDEDTYFAFRKMTEAYKETMVGAIERMITQSLDTYSLPGFVPIKKVVENDLAEANKVPKYILDKKMNS